MATKLSSTKLRKIESERREIYNAFSPEVRGDLARMFEVYARKGAHLIGWW